ncbi:MAG: GFA family protein [Phormidium sp.]
MVSVFAVQSPSEPQIKRASMPVIAGCVGDGAADRHDCIACGSDVQIDGVEKLKVYQSSEWAQRAFCGECGTHIFYKLLPTSEYFVPAGLFQNEIEFEFKEQIFIDRKPSYYEFANQTLNLTEAEVFAKFALSEEN